MRQHHQASMTARRKHVSVVYLPSVNMRSSQQLCLSTAPLQLSPVLSAMVPEVPVVRMLSGRDGDSWGGWSDMSARLLVGTMYGGLLGREGEFRE